MGFVKRGRGFARAYYLRSGAGYPLTITSPLQLGTLSISGNLNGVGDLAEDGRYKIPLVFSGINKAYPSQIMTEGFTRIGLDLLYKDDIYSINGTSTQQNGIGFANIYGLKPSAEYTIMLIPVDGDISTCYEFMLYFPNAGNINFSSTFLAFTSRSNITGFCIALRGVAAGKKVNASFKMFVVEGTYTADTIPAYEPYHEPQTFNIYLDAPLYGNDNVSDTLDLNFENRTATRTDRISVDDSGNITELETPVTTDISDKIDWTGIPNLWSGTVILTADTTVLPSNIAVKYRADKPE